MPETSSRPVTASITANFAEELPQFRTRTFTFASAQTDPSRARARLIDGGWNRDPLASRERWHRSRGLSHIVRRPRKRTICRTFLRTVKRLDSRIGPGGACRTASSLGRVAGAREDRALVEPQPP